LKVYNTAYDDSNDEPVLLLWRPRAVRVHLLRMLQEPDNRSMRLRRALLLAAGAILLPAIASGQT
jgi:hypothetical protein